MRLSLGLAMVIVLVVLVVLIAALPRILSGDSTSETSARTTGEATERPPVVESLPVPQFGAPEAPGGICDDDGVQSALAAGDDEGVVTAAGGGEAFRAAVAAGAAPCISLSDASRRWVVVNKLRPLDPVDSVPAPLVSLTAVRSLSGGNLRQDAADALTALHDGAEASGVGEVAMLSGYRSYTTQQSTYAQHVGSDGQEVADLESARPGYSEHQTGITLDLVACDGGCGGLDEFAASPQGRWVAEHAWEYGFIIRYQDGATDITGYKAEPWHLRFLGPQLARAYHDGGWRSLEEFFGLPAAPDYAD
jgi:D-alanyl-D-alanine carboxypeptidase